MLVVGGDGKSMKTPEFTTEHAVATVCPLDCPDGCSLEATVQDGRVVSIDGSHVNPVTDGYICAKVRRFPERVYGPDRLTYPAIRKGPKGAASFERVTWDEALAAIAGRLIDARDTWGGESILPYSYGGSNGLLTQDTSDATLFRRLGSSRLARTVCAAPTGAANLSMYGKMPSVTYKDFPEARLIIVWGANPSSSGVHLVPHIRAAQNGCANGRASGRSNAPPPKPTSRLTRCAASPTCTPRPARRSFAAATARNATGTAGARRWPSWRSPPSAASSASAGAAT